MINGLYYVLGISSFLFICMIAFFMRGKGNGLTAISNSNLSLFENIKSYGVEKKMQKICGGLAALIILAIILYPIMLKLVVK